MNELSEKQSKLIARLEAIPKVRPIYILILMAAVICCWIFFVIRYPLLANPFYVIGELKKGTYPESVFSIIAAFFPMLFSICWLLLLFDIVTGFFFLKQRGQLLEIIRELKSENEKIHP